MAYRNDQTERARLHRLWIIELDRPCVYCDGKDNREIHHTNGDHSITDETTCCVACRPCHLARHPMSKFAVGDRVRLTVRTPAMLDFTDYERSRPRTIIAIRYSIQHQANYYRLGSNGRGKMLDGQPLDGFDYEFRSFMLMAYIPRAYHFKRAYTLRPDDARLTSKSRGIKRLASAKRQVMPASQP